MPANASISFTLDACYTDTTMSLGERASGDDFEVEIYLDNERNEGFEPKVTKFFTKVVSQYPWLRDHKIIVRTSNTFPHSSGIASSASAFSAMAFCLESIDLKLKGDSAEPDRKKVSFVARLGSGSACRSVNGGLMVWGEHSDFEGSDDTYAVQLNGAHQVFHDYQDAILLVHKGTKEVSSTVGHGLIDDHPFAQQRFEQAAKNMSAIKQALINGDEEKFIEIVESEALTLHALMMSSTPSFILMKPGTLSIINEIREFRKQSGVPVCFTLDAGANVHMLFPARAKEVVTALIEEKLKRYCENDAYICDQVGSGPIETDLIDA